MSNFGNHLDKMNEYQMIDNTKLDDIAASFKEQLSSTKDQEILSAVQFIYPKLYIDDLISSKEILAEFKIAEFPHKTEFVHEGVLLFGVETTQDFSIITTRYY